MTNLNPVETYITVSDVFPDTPNDLNSFIELIKGLSKTDSIIWCARLNNILGNWNLKDDEKQKFGVRQFLSDEDVKYLDQTIKRQGKKSATLFFRGQILELLRWVVLHCKDHPNDGVTFNAPEVRRAFAKALLISSDIWEKWIFKNWEFKNDEDIETQKNLVLGSSRKIIESHRSNPELEKTLGRGLTLFNDYLSQIYNSFYLDFQNTTGLSLEGYYICLVSIITNFMKEDSGNIFNINNLGNDSQSSALFQKYIKLESQSSQELETSLWSNIDSFDSVPDYDWKAIREKPIFITEDGRGIIIDPIFYCERALIGPLFYVSKSNGNQVFSDFGKAFEKYACDILKRIYPESNLLHKRLVCNIEVPTKKKVNIGEIDACVDDVYEVLLFEMKAVFIREDTYNSPEELIKTIKEKYGVVETENSSSVKGVGQLARIIKEVVINKMKLKDIDFSEVKKIYPILLVHDALFNAPLYGEFLAKEFKKLIEPEAILSNNVMIKKGVKILPLILMTVEELENIETACEHYEMKKLLNDYSNGCVDRKVSIHNFVAGSSEYSFYHNKFLATKSMEIMDKVGKYIFKDTYNGFTKTTEEEAIR